MKKILMVLTIFLIRSDIAVAAERVVTSYIISDRWYENIFLMADKVDSMGTSNFTVQVGGGEDSVGGELLYHFPTWYNAKFAPKLFYEDLNGDGLKDIAVSLISGAGVSVSTKEIHVLHQVQDPNTRYEEVPVEPLKEAIKRLVKLDRKGDDILILTDKQKYVINYAKLGYSTPIHTPGAGSIESYDPKDGKLKATTNVFVTIPEANIGTLSVTYRWEGTKYRAESVRFESIQE